MNLKTPGMQFCDEQSYCTSIPPNKTFHNGTVASAMSFASMHTFDSDIHEGEANYFAYRKILYCKNVMQLSFYQLITRTHKK